MDQRLFAGGLVMRGFLKFFALVVLLVPVWIVFLTMTSEDRLKQRSNIGPLVAVDQALQGAGDGRWVSVMVRMDPTSPADAWRLEGLTTVPDGADAMTAQHFVAVAHTKCLPLSDAACWVVDRLDFSLVDDVLPDAPGSGTGLVDVAEAQRLLIVQEQLREMGFDPGPSDGALGPQTQQAVRDYVAQANGSAAEATSETQANVTGDPTAQALVDLEVMGLLARGERHHARGEYHAALQVYAKAIQLDPRKARAWFNRGLIYQEMGLPDLAILEYDMSLALSDDQVLVYHSRGNAHFDIGDHWRAFADHADGLGVRYLGDQYLVVTGRIGETWTQVEPQLVAMLEWAEGAWDQAKATIEEKLQSSDAGSAEEAT
jgi:peptidoglycan hydrolase-like protein with peptidoglycan-binding domain